MEKLNVAQAKMLRRSNVGAVWAKTLLYENKAEIKIFRGVSPLQSGIFKSRAHCFLCKSLIYSMQGIVRCAASKTRCRNG